MKMLHPCKCKSYNGGQCYNCLNGAHDLCSDGCKTKRSKRVGVKIIVEDRANKMMDQCRAAACLINQATGHNAEEFAMQAFMDIFHPGHPMTRELVNDVRNKKRGYR